MTDVAGGPAVRLTSGVSDTEPTWSPDRKQIAFRRGKLGTGAEIYVINANGTGLRRLTRNSIPDGLPAWSRTAARRLTCEPALVRLLVDDRRSARGQPVTVSLRCLTPGHVRSGRRVCRDSSWAGAPGRSLRGCV